MTIAFTYGEICQLQKSYSSQVDRVLYKFGREKWNNKPLNFRQLYNLAEDYSFVTTFTHEWLLSIFFKTDKVSFKNKMKLVSLTLDFLLEKSFSEYHDDLKDYGLFEMNVILRGYLYNYDRLLNFDYRSIFIETLQKRIKNLENMLEEQQKQAGQYISNQQVIWCWGECSNLLIDMINGEKENSIYFDTVMLNLCYIAVNGISGNEDDLKNKFYEYVTSTIIALTTD